MLFAVSWGNATELDLYPELRVFASNTEGDTFPIYSAIMVIDDLMFDLTLKDAGIEDLDCTFVYLTGSSNQLLTALSEAKHVSAVFRSDGKSISTVPTKENLAALKTFAADMLEIHYLAHINSGKKESEQTYQDETPIVSYPTGDEDNSLTSSTALNNPI